MKKDQTKTLAYMALYVALYVVLKYAGDLIPILKMPNGGSIELELVAVFIASYHLGWQYGITVSLLSWLMTIILGSMPYYVHPVQIFLDYAGPLMACGAASLLWPFRDLNAGGRTILSILLAAGAFFGIYLSFAHDILHIILAVLCAAVTFAFSYWYIKEKKEFGIVISMLLKYLFTVLSGAYYWAGDAGAGSAAAWTFSLTYNLGYNLVTMIVCLILVPVLIDRLKKLRITFKY